MRLSIRHLTQMEAAIPPIRKSVVLFLAVLAILAGRLASAGYFDQTPLVRAAILQSANQCSGNKDCSAFADKLLSSNPAAVCAAIAEKGTDSLTKMKANSEMYVQAFSMILLKVGADNVPGCAQRYIPIPDEQ